MKSKTFTSSFNLFYLFLCVVWKPVQKYYLHIDTMGRTIMILSIIAILLNVVNRKKYKDVFRSSVFLIWLVLVCYSIVNLLFKGFVSEYRTFDFLRLSFFDSLIFLCIAIIELYDNKPRCLKTLFVAQLVYLIIGSLHMGVSLDSDRMSADFMGNALPLMGVACVFITGVLFDEHGFKREWITFLAVVIFILFITIISATRKAFGAILIVTIGGILGRYKTISTRMMVTTILSVIVLYFGINWVLNNTFLGERLEENNVKFDYPLSANQKVNDFLMIILGDRAYFYYYGSQIYHQHPITGIGLTNFPIVNQSNIRIHSEYMVQLCENGLIGFSLLMLFYILMIRSLVKKRRKEKIPLVYLFGLFSVLFLNLTTWTYDRLYIMIIYAVLIVQSCSKQTIDENSDTSPQGQLQ